MKNRILVFLVFITTFLNAQSVDPETFPTVVGAISGKNLYTNTGGEGKVSIKAIMDSVDILDTATITYADFYTAITGGNLVVGKTYIIVDFQTIYDQMDFDAGGSLKPTLVTKTGATEQIWVYALSNNQIASKAYSATYPNDQIQYDWTYNTTLVNGAPAKGRISERIDENNNRTDYDHREIKFIRYDDGAGNFTVINDNGNASGEFLTFVQNFTGGTVKDNWLGDYYSIGQLLGQEYANNIFFGNVVNSNNTSVLFLNNTFGNFDVYSNSFNGEITNNIFLSQAIRNDFSGNINNNLFDSYIQTNNFSGDITNNTFSGDITNNTFSGNVNQNTFSGGVTQNIFSGNVNQNTFSDIANNTFSGNVNQNTFSGGVTQNIFSGNVNSNTFSGYVYNNTFSGDVNSNTFTHTSLLGYCTIASTLNNKTIDETTYPILFGNDYKKEILKGSDNKDYIKTFDGTIDQYILIP